MVERYHEATVAQQYLHVESNLVWSLCVKDVQPLTRLVGGDSAIKLFDRHGGKYIEGVLDAELKFRQLAFRLEREPNLLKVNVLSDTINYVLPPTGDVSPLSIDRLLQS